MLASAVYSTPAHMGSIAPCYVCITVLCEYYYKGRELYKQCYTQHIHCSILSLPFHILLLTTIELLELR